MMRSTTEPEPQSLRSCAKWPAGRLHTMPLIPLNKPDGIIMRQLSSPALAV